jgi:acetylglutamate kinase
MSDEKLGFVGNIHHVECDPVVRLLDAGYIPVISSLGSDGKGQCYNINADLAAGELAASLKAEKLVILTNTEGVYEDFKERSQLISEVDAATLKELKKKGSFQAGMIPKIDAIMTALSRGVASAHVLDGRRKHAVLLEFFTARGIGTMIFP